MNLIPILSMKINAVGLVLVSFVGYRPGQGGSVPPTGKETESDYVYGMEFNGKRIRHLNNIWDDVGELKQLGFSLYVAC